MGKESSSSAVDYQDRKKKRRKLRNVVAGAALATTITSGASAAVLLDIEASGTNKATTTHFEPAPQRSNLHLDFHRGVVDTQAKPAQLINQHKVVRGDTMNELADKSLKAAGIAATFEQRKVHRAVQEAANPQVTDRDLIFADRTVLNQTETPITQQIAQAAQGLGEGRLLKEVADVKEAKTLDDARKEAVDVLREVGITPTRAEDVQRTNENKGVPDVAITRGEIDTAVAAKVLEPKTLKQKGDNLWDNTETVLEEDLGRDPQNAEINPINRIEQVVNKIVNPNINFNRMPVGAEYTGVSEKASIIIGVVSSADQEALNAAPIRQDVKDRVNTIQELNHQPETRGVTAADKAATKLILAMKPNQMTDAIMNKIVAIYKETNEDVKNAQLIALLQEQSVIDALLGNAASNPDKESDSLHLEDRRSDSNDSNGVYWLAAGLGTAVLVGGALMYRNRRRKGKHLKEANAQYPTETFASEEKLTDEQKDEVINRLLRERALTIEEEKDQRIAFPAEMPPNVFETRFYDEFGDILKGIADNDSKVEADRLLDVLREKVAAEPVVDKTQFVFGLAKRVFFDEVSRVHKERYDVYAYLIKEEKNRTVTPQQA